MELFLVEELQASYYMNLLKDLNTYFKIFPRKL